MARHSTGSLAQLARQCGWQVWQRREDPASGFRDLVLRRDEGWSESALATWVGGRVSRVRVRRGSEAGPDLSLSKLAQHLEDNPGGYAGQEDAA